MMPLIKKIVVVWELLCMKFVLNLWENEFTDVMISEVSEGCL